MKGSFVMTLFATQLLLFGLPELALPMEDYLLMDSSDVPLPDSTSLDLETTSIVLLPTPTSSESLPTSEPLGPTSSHTPAPTVSPMPSPNAFFDYSNKNLYLYLQNLKFEYRYPRPYTMLGTELLSMDLATDTPSDDTLVATYSEEEDKKFEITFFFDSSPSTDEWYLQGVQHRNFTEFEGELLYQYTGLEFSIRTKIGRAFNCSSIEFIGNSPGDTPHYSRIKFMNLSVEAFLNGGKVSSDFDTCDSAAVLDESVPVEVIVGVSVAVGVTLATSVTTIAIVAFKKYQKRKEYDLLSGD